LKARLRQIVINSGRLTLLQIHKLIGRYSLIGDQPFFGPEQFPWHTTLLAKWSTIRAELDSVMRKREHLPNIQELSPDQAEITYGDNWKTFFFFAYGLVAEPNCRRCPETARLLKNVPGIKTAFFSILKPHAHIPQHCGAYKGVIRYHLGMIVPRPEEKCRIRVGGITAHWREGEAILFDDTFPHEVWNDTEGVRVVLLLDVVRPLPFPVSLLNDFIIRLIAASPFVRDAAKNYQQWERRIAAVWDK
jgi:aspartyl/asparaginyl beta-hydroxylase (cupin superfamily)